MLSGVAGNPERPPGLLLGALYRRRFVAIVCPLLLEEVRRGLDRGYFRDRVTPEEAERVIRFLTNNGIRLRDPRDPPSVLRDPDDDYLVALATTARARAIVTGDKDLLHHPGLHPPALTPRAACELLGVL